MTKIRAFKEKNWVVSESPEMVGLWILKRKSPNWKISLEANETEFCDFSSNLLDKGMDSDFLNRAVFFWEKKSI